MAKFNFDSSEVDMNNATAGGGNYDPIPDGEYTLEAIDAEEKETAAGGVMIKAKFEVVGGEYAGRWIWQNFNVVNKSEKAQNIGRAQLVAWATAAGKPEADDTDKLLGKKFKALVGIQEGTNGYKDSNRVKAFLFDKPEAAEKKAPAAKAAAKPAASAQSSQNKGAGKNPWDD